MQRIEFIQNLEEIVKRLKSREIVNHFREGLEQPNKDYNFTPIIPLLFTSKSQFDQMMLDERLKVILESIIQDHNFFDEQAMASLPRLLGSGKAYSILVNQQATSFYVFHSGLVETLDISIRLLTKKIINNSSNENLDEGIIIFNVSIDNEGLSTEKYIKILSLMDELVKTFNKIYKKESESESEIIYLDTGSDSNIGLKTDIDTAKAIFLIFKEIWTFVTSFNYIRVQKKNQAILDSLSIRKEIQKMVDEGLMGQKEAQEYIHFIKTRTDDLIGLKVVPRALISKYKTIDIKHMLEEYNMKMIEEKKTE